VVEMLAEAKAAAEVKESKDGKIPDAVRSN
jgi:hypothetical protein